MGRAFGVGNRSSQKYERPRGASDAPRRRDCGPTGAGSCRRRRSSQTKEERMSRTTLRRLLVVAAALVVGTLATAMPAFGADTFTPNPVNVTLPAGESTTVHKTLHLDALPGAADIIIAIDTTGSMAAAIAQAKAQATQLCTDVQNAIPAARFAVFDFRDVPDRPATNGVLILTPVFTSSCVAVQAAINAMSAGGGGDIPEAYNWVFNKAYSDAVLNASRNPDAVQFLVVLGDAPPHNSPAPAVAPACGNTPPADARISSDTEIAGLNAHDITLLMINYGPVLSCYQQLSVATGGTAVNSGGNLSTDIINQIKAAAAHIDTVDLVVSGMCPPVGISFNPPFPQGPFTAPVDITFDEVITAPTLVGVYSCGVTAVVDGTPRAVQHGNGQGPVREPDPGNHGPLLRHGPGRHEWLEDDERQRPGHVLLHQRVTGRGRDQGVRRHQQQRRPGCWGAQRHGQQDVGAPDEHAWLQGHLRRPDHDGRR